MSQVEYMSNLKPVQLDRKRGTGRTLEAQANETEVADFRSLVAGIAWLGVTHGGAQAGASLYQGCLPNPTIKDVVGLSSLLQQLREEYRPLKFISGFSLDDIRILPVCDSSLGNNNKYSQGAHTLLLARASTSTLCGQCILINTRSGKSKRVANSSMAAETLALLQGCEEAVLLQSWLFELRFPSMTAMELLNTTGTEMSEIIPCTDCEDLHAVLVKPASPAPTNRSLVLHLSALRDYKEQLNVREYVWIATDDNLATPLTKLNKDGRLPLDILTLALETCRWDPRSAYKYGSTLVHPKAAPIQATGPRKGRLNISEASWTPFGSFTARL